MPSPVRKPTVRQERQKVPRKIEEAPVIDNAVSDGRGTRYMMTDAERKALLRKQYIDMYVTMLLDTEHHTYDEIAETINRELGMEVNVRKLKNDQRQIDFRQTFGELNGELRAAPELSIARRMLNDLSIDAVKALRKVIEDPRTSGKTLVEAAKVALDMSRIIEPEMEDGDKSNDLATWMMRIGSTVNVTQVNIQNIIATSTPQEYLDALTTIQIPAQLNPAQEVTDFSIEEASIVEEDVV